MKNIKVENMTTASGNTAPNQFIIGTPKGVYFQSYDTVIAFKPNNGKTVLDKNAWDYSRTTSKYLGWFLGENKAQTRKKIETKEYLLKDLNK